MPDFGENPGVALDPPEEPGTWADEDTGRRVAGGTLLLMAAQVLALGVGFVIAAFLTRRLGPSNYGLYSVVTAVVLWAEVAVSALFRETTIKLLAEAEDWRGATSALVQLQGLSALGVTALLIVCASPVSRWLNAPELSGYLRLYALDVPCFALSGVAIAALVGRGEYGKAAFVSGLGWGGRLGLVLLLVGSGLSVAGAILATIGSSFVALIASWYFVRPRLFGKATVPQRLIWSYSLPLLVQSVGRQLFQRVDLPIVQALAGASAAGFYGAARNLTLVPASFFTASFSQVLLSRLPPLLARGEASSARALMRQSMRLVLWLLPFAGLAAGAGSEVAALVYGRPFLSAGAAVGLLAFGAVGLAMMSIAFSILIASGRPGHTAAVTIPLVPLSLAGYVALVPRLGIAGTAAVMTTLAWMGAGCAILAIYRQYGAAPRPATLLRVSLTALTAYTLGSIWPAPGVWVILKLVVGSVIILACLFLLRELTAGDLAFVRLLLRPEGGRGI